MKPTQCGTSSLCDTVSAKTTCQMSTLSTEVTLTPH